MLGRKLGCFLISLMNVARLRWSTSLAVLSRKDDESILACGDAGDVEDVTVTPSSMAADCSYKLDARLQSELNREIIALIQQPENGACADCAARLRPRSAFLSITLGVWLCNRCYGIHRSVGAHITRTKCVGLDAFSRDEVRFMAAHGNRRAAMRYEAAVPPGTARPSAASSDGEVEAWIREKYERRAFCREEGRPAAPPPQPAEDLLGSLISLEAAAAPAPMAGAPALAPPPRPLADAAGQAAPVLEPYTSWQASTPPQWHACAPPGQHPPRLPGPGLSAYNSGSHAPRSACTGDHGQRVRDIMARFSSRGS